MGHLMAPKPTTRLALILANPLKETASESSPSSQPVSRETCLSPSKFSEFFPRAERDDLLIRNASVPFPLIPRPPGTGMKEASCSGADHLARFLDQALRTPAVEVESQLRTEFHKLLAIS